MHTTGHNSRLIQSGNIPDAAISTAAKIGTWVGRGNALSGRIRFRFPLYHQKLSSSVRFLQIEACQSVVGKTMASIGTFPVFQPGFVLIRHDSPLKPWSQDISNNLDRLAWLIDTDLSPTPLSIYWT